MQCTEMSDKSTEATAEENDAIEVMLAEMYRETEKLQMHWIEVCNTQGTDQRWANIARTHFQEGFMALERAITKKGAW